METEWGNLQRKKELGKQSQEIYIERKTQGNGVRRFRKKEVGKQSEEIWKER